MKERIRASSGEYAVNLVAGDPLREAVSPEERGLPVAGPDEWLLRSILSFDAGFSNGLRAELNGIRRRKGLF